MAIDDIFPVSPVPSDANLHPDELPFTAFGQFGEDRLDLRVFEQDIYWVNIHGEPFLLTEMSQDYLTNVLKHIYNHMDTYFVNFLKKTMIEVAMYSMNDLQEGSIISHKINAEITKKTPAEWLTSTPLVKKLDSLIED